MTRYSFAGVSLPAGDDVIWWVEDGVLTDRPLDGAEQLPGRFVLPGLVDAHCHLTLARGTAGPQPATAEDAFAYLGRLRSSGVLALRDTGAHDRTPLLLAGSDGDVRVQACGRFLSSADHYFPGVYRPVSADELADAAVAEVRAGAAWVKLVADFPSVSAGRMTRPEQTFDIDVVAGMVDAVHRLGARVAAHVTTPLVADLVRVGIDSVEHGTALDDATLREMATRGAAWTPTLCAVTSRPPDDAPPDLMQRWRDRQELMRELLPRAVALGVTVLTGSDVVGTVPGEVALLTSYGVQPVDALAAATTSARRYFGFDPLAAGAPADLVTYDADPRDDPEVLAHPAAVVAAGVRVC